MKLNKNKTKNIYISLIKGTRHIYKNWYSLFTNYILRRPIGSAKLRNESKTIQFSKWNANAFLLAALLDNGWNFYSRSSNLLELFNNKLHLKFLLDVDLREGFHSIYEIFVEKIYDFQIDFNDKLIVDIGMNIGDSSLFFAAMGAKEVLGLEPVTETYEKAIRNITLSNYQGIVIPLNLGLSSCLGVGEISFSEQASALATNLKCINKIDTFEVKKVAIENTTLEELVNIRDIHQIDILKMDCEGCEFDVIPHLQDELFNKISIIIMEYHDYPHDIIKILKGHSFRITYEENRKSGLLFAENRTKVIK